MEDNGPGVDPEIMDHLFDPYFTSKPMGTGIGLVVCARILAEHGGTISVDRERTLGARFTLTLPNLLPETMDATGQEGTT